MALGISISVSKRLVLAILGFWLLPLEKPEAAFGPRLDYIAVRGFLGFLSILN